jgi:hypothetical protein
MAGDHVEHGRRQVGRSCSGAKGKGTMQLRGGGYMISHKGGERPSVRVRFEATMLEKVL